jgi:hypothetical protein
MEENIDRKEKLKALVTSFEASTSAAMDSLKSGNFDLWSKMYGFVILGLKKSVFGLSEAIQ